MELVRKYDFSLRTFEGPPLSLT